MGPRPKDTARNGSLPPTPPAMAISTVGTDCFQAGQVCAASWGAGWATCFLTFRDPASGAGSVHGPWFQAGLTGTHGEDGNEA